MPFGASAADLVYIPLIALAFIIVWRDAHHRKGYIVEDRVVVLSESGGVVVAHGPFTPREASRFVEHWAAEGFTFKMVRLDTHACGELRVTRIAEH